MPNGVTWNGVTKWLVALVAAAFVALGSAALTTASTARSDVDEVRAALEGRIGENSDAIHSNREVLGRLDERLNSIDRALGRIERALEAD
ncbi:MAG: hypothetical protein PVH68_04730 [Armatimonadota bacterium]|jgi:hypothetical protein